MTMEIRPVTLDGRRIRMEPLSFEPHFEGLMAIGLEPELWKWTINVIESRADLRAYLEEALRMQAEGSALPFATVDKATGKVVWEYEMDAGSTGTLMTYLHKGTQYIVVAIGGQRHPAEFIAFALGQP